MIEISTLLDRIRQAGGMVIVVNGDLRLKVPKGLLSDQDKQVLVEYRDQVNADQWGRLPSPAPCTADGGIEAWWDFAGGRHCSHCEAEGLERSAALVEQADRIRAKAPLQFKVKGKAPKQAPAPWPPAHLQLPKTIEGIERGRPQSARQLDFLYDTKERRIERLSQQ